MVRHVRDSILSALLLVFATLLTGCAGVREQTIGPEYPGEFSQLYNSPCEWSYNPYYAYGRPDYCDPFLGEPFRSHYYFIHDPYWYYYNAYFYPYQPYYPFYPYAPITATTTMTMMITATAANTASAVFASTGMMTAIRRQTGSMNGKPGEKTAGKRFRTLFAMPATRAWSSGRASGSRRRTGAKNATGSGRISAAACRTASGRCRKNAVSAGTVFSTMRKTCFQASGSSGRSASSSGAIFLKSTVCCVMIITSPCLSIAIILLAMGTVSSMAAYCAAGAAGGNSGYWQ